KLSFDTYFTRDVADLVREHRERVDHAVDCVRQFGNFTFRFQNQLPLQVSIRNVGNDLGDTAHLSGQVRCHEVDVIGEVFPRAGDAAHFRLAAELTFRADLARHAGNFRGEAVELIHHRVDGVLKLEDFALHVHGDFPAQVPVCHRCGDLRNVSNLRG